MSQTDTEAQSDQVAGEAQQADAAKSDAPVEKTDEQRLAERPEGGATSPEMPWGKGPRPDGWVDPQVEDDAATPAPAVHHRMFGDDGHSIEVDGKWYALVDDQPEKLSALEAQGLSAREACEKLGIAIEPGVEPTVAPPATE
jgi:hypothetical protein